MNSKPQFASNYSSPELYNHSKRQFKNSRLTPFFIFVSGFFILFLITVVYFQSRISKLNKIVSSLTQGINCNSEPPSPTHLQDHSNKANLINNFNLSSSSIITTKKQIRFIHRLFKSFQDSYVLVYRASYLGDSHEDISRVLTQNNHLLILIKTENGEIIGGYIHQKFIMYPSSFLYYGFYNDRSFVFDIINEIQQYMLLNKRDCEGIVCFSHEIIIYDNFFSSNENFYDFSNKSEEYKIDKTDKNYHSFKVKELEIYKVIYNFVD